MSNNSSNYTATIFHSSLNKSYKVHSVNWWSRVPSHTGCTSCYQWKYVYFYHQKQFCQLCCPHHHHDENKRHQMWSYAPFPYNYSGKLNGNASGNENAWVCGCGACGSEMEKILAARSAVLPVMSFNYRLKPQGQICFSNAGKTKLNM